VRIFERRFGCVARPGYRDGRSSQETRIATNVDTCRLAEHVSQFVWIEFIARLDA